MEVLVVVAIITVVGAVAFPIVSRMREKTAKTEALSRMGTLAKALKDFAAQNNGELPLEGVEGKDDWERAQSPEAEKAWYNALPKLAGKKGVADYVKEGRIDAFYSTESVLWLPGANYPEGRKSSKPYFAIAMNTKLHRRDRDGRTDAEAKRPAPKLDGIKEPTRTVVLLEMGLPQESKAHETLSKKDYNGSSKGSAKTFVARYSGKGILAFADGHAEEFAGKDLLAGDGNVLWDEQSPASTKVLWMADPKEDPNQKN
jgi:prepilin-type processing-associated H-X9-DG protein